MSKKNKEGFETRAIHAGQKADPTTGAVMMPIYTSSTYEQESPGVHKGFDYSRSINPTRKAFEECIASLENGEVGFGFSSGVAAISACVELLSPGDHVIAMNDLYGGTVRLFNEIKTLSQGIEVTYVDMTDMQNVLEAKTDKTKMIFVETPTNPLLRVVDLSAIADFAKAENILSVCDNTFASPYVQQPLNHGIDIVLHSATKYLRMERHSENAMAIAKHFESHKEISEVIYPGLTNHPQHDLASKQMNGFGGIISMNIKGGLEKSKSFLERTKIFALAESLGGVESLIEHPALMTHASLPKDRREMIGISDGLVRLSVGLESLDDLIEDIEQALK